MKEILILGALPKDEEDKALYSSIIEVCRGYADKVSSPLETAVFKGSDSERYERAFEKVKDADLVIGEQSMPSTGQGMEIREAAILKKPLLVIARSGSRISGLVRGCPLLKEIIYYNSIKDLRSKLKEFLDKRWIR